jgi:DNA processing protein
LSDAAKELAQVQATGCRLLAWDEPEYPARLREICDPPPLLYVRGNIELLKRHMISVAGARRPTPYGNQMAERISRDLADQGLVISSGLAHGIDAPQNFSIRNRIIAGMALGVVVVEGAQYSGCMITARLAMEFAREVFGVPGHVTQPSSFGPNSLTEQGAKLVTGWEDIVEELPTPYARSECPSNRHPMKNDQSWSRVAMAYGEAAVCATERGRGPTCGRIGRGLSSLTSSEVLAALFDMGLKSVIRQLPGKQFLKVLL